MALRFADFAPQLLEARLFRGNQFESLEDAVDAMNAWITGNGVHVVNVETVVLPSLWDEDGTADPELMANGQAGTHWHQFFRVWYDDRS